MIWIFCSAWLIMSLKNFQQLLPILLWLRGENSWYIMPKNKTVIKTFKFDGILLWSGRHFIGLLFRRWGLRFDVIKYYTHVSPPVMVHVSKSSWSLTFKNVSIFYCKIQYCMSLSTHIKSGRDLWLQYNQIFRSSKNTV